MRARTGGKYCFAIVLGALKRASPSRLMVRGVITDLLAFFTVLYYNN